MAALQSVTLKKLLLTPETPPRLRAGYRLALQWGLLLLLVNGTPGLLRRFLSFISPPLAGIPFVTGELATFVLITLSVWLARRLLDRRSLVSLGLHPTRRGLRDLLVGFLIAGLVVGLIFAVENSLGWMIWKRPFWLPLKDHPWWRLRHLDEAGRGLGIALVIYLLNGWQEEILRRGYQLQNIAAGLNLGWGMLLSSVLFGLGHSSNPGFTWQAGAGLTLLGLWFASGYACTRSLWLPIGLHLGWNFFEGPVFGFPVSGNQYFSLLEYRISAPRVITGGEFGPEAGLILVPALALGLGLVVWYTRGRRSARKPQEKDTPGLDPL